LAGFAAFLTIGFVSFVAFTDGALAGLELATVLPDFAALAALAGAFGSDFFVFFFSHDLLSCLCVCHELHFENLIRIFDGPVLRRIAFLNLVYKFYSGDHLSENGILAI